ncbi:MAG: histidine phosphatase family protein [Gemmataceae bacterium]|nr:histidine phosphatase family protein [Gemmataceae bacterium]
MRLYLIRHAEAVPLGTEGVSTDEERPLTEAGRASCGPLAKALGRIGVKLDRLFTSPLVRAVQTAEGLVAGWQGEPPPVEETPLLSPGKKKRKLATMLGHAGGEALGLVGHNPDLSELVGWFIGDKGIGVNMEKAGVACLEFERRPARAGGMLVWLITPEWTR